MSIQAGKGIRSALRTIWGKYQTVDRTEGWLRFMRDELKYTHETSSSKFQDAVDACAHQRPFAIRSCHGVGKTAFGATISLTTLALVPKVVILQMSPTWRQVTKIFWNEVRKWYPQSSLIQTLFDIQPKAPEIRSLLNPEKWYMVGLASNNPGLVEGFHVDQKSRILRLTDETKAISNQIIEATDGALSVGTAWTGDLSTPADPEEDYTYFYDCFKKLKAGRTTIHISSEESKLVSKQWVESMILKYGITSPIVQARVFGNFPEGGEKVLIPLRSAEAFFEIPEDWQVKGSKSMGIDVARFGQDETVIAVWTGNTLTRLEPASGLSVNEVVEKAWRIALEEQCFVIVTDDIGVGGGVTDGLRVKADNYTKQEYVVIGFVASEAASPDESDTFAKLGDEVWWYFAQAVNNRTLKSKIYDDDLEFQLTSYKKEFPGGKIKVVWPKREERASKSNSPDRGDALVLGWYGLRIASGSKRAFEQDQDLGLEDDMAFGGLSRREF